ncbi:MAG: carboxyl-terminal protease [Croceitalea sp.]|nr:carboxyl-terminal protease [Croceitalea sp.]NNL07688.1 carboxyl-terminal protease [Croceitalea sp.]
MKKFASLGIGLLLLIVGCSDNDDMEVLTPTDNDVTVQNFMWKAMNYWYFWQDEVPDLADDRFSSNTEYTEFLQATPNPEDFYSQIQFTEDRFSFLNEDYEVLLNSFSGVSKSNGLQFFVIDLIADDTDNLFGFVRNVVPGSDADEKGLKRGDVFTGVNGQTLTQSNYIDLLFSDVDSYTLNMGDKDVENRLVVPNDQEITLISEEGLLENPIRVSTTFDINGQKIGYLMYQRFNRSFDSELNEVFAQFVAEGVTDLIIDLRYNPGGSVNTTVLLASMIYGTNTNDLFIKQRWNTKRQASFSASQVEDYFANSVNGSPLNTLNLNKVYLIATNRSASASELLINGLDPYVEVIHVGDVTRGKNEFSITLVDDPENNYQYTSSRENQINPDNRWVIQPLVGRNENSVGFIDYTSGFVPDIEFREDVFNLSVLGDVNEPLLARTIEDITGISSKIRMAPESQDASKVRVFETPVNEIMYLDKTLFEE